MERKTFTIKDSEGNEVEAVRIALMCYVDEPTRELWGNVADDRGQGIAAFLNDVIKAGVAPFIETYNADPEGVAARAAERAANRKTPAANGRNLSPEEKQATRLENLKAAAQTKLTAAHEKAEAMKAAAAKRVADLEAGILPEPKPRKPKAPSADVNDATPVEA